MFIFNIASGLGLANVLITERDLDKRVAGTLLTMMVVSGAIVALVVVAVAPAMAALFDITETPLSEAEHRRLTALLKRVREHGDKR